MIEKLTNILHVGPLIVISLIMIGNKIFQTITNKTIDFSPTILLLSSIGIASGFSIHQAHEFSTMCYLCFGYASVLAIVALKLARSKKTSKAKV